MNDAIREQLARQVVELEAERDAAVERAQALAAHVERLREGLDQALVHWGANVADEDGTAYAECEKRCDESPESSLARLKAEWQAEALEWVRANPYVALNTRITELRRQAEEPTP